MVINLSKNIAMRVYWDSLRSVTNIGTHHPMLNTFFTTKNIITRLLPYKAHNTQFDYWGIVRQYSNIF